MELSRRFARSIGRMVATTPAGVYNIIRAIRCSIDRPYIIWHARRGRPFILVYQHGRVASTSVDESLRALRLRYPIYHVHTVSPARAEQRIGEVRGEHGRIDRNLFVGRILGREMARLKSDDQEPWKIVSIFRDPISVMISLHFMHAEKYFGSLLDDGGRLDPRAAIAHLRDMFTNDDPSGWTVCNWYDQVFREELGVDVYDHEFDRDTGYAVLDDPKFRILLIRYEDLSVVFNQAVAEWLGLEEQAIRLDRFHIHKDKRFEPVHETVRRHLKLPQEACEKIYSTKFCKHFYSRASIDALMARWVDEGER